MAPAPIEDAVLGEEARGLAKGKRESCKAAPEAAELPSDLFARLDQLKRVALACSQRVLDESGGKVWRLTPHHSELLSVVIRELHARRDSVPTMPSRAKLWDAGVYPHPAEFSIIPIPWSPSHRKWTENWLRMLRHRSQQGEEELHALRRAERAQPSEKSKQAAIARFHEGGELRRLLHPQSYQSTFTPTLRSNVPSRIEVTGGSPSIQELKVVLAGIAELDFLQEVDSVVVDGISPAYRRQRNPPGK